MFAYDKVHQFSGHILFSPTFPKQDSLNLSNHHVVGQGGLQNIVPCNEWVRMVSGWGVKW